MTIVKRAVLVLVLAALVSGCGLPASRAPAGPDAGDPGDPAGATDTTSRPAPTPEPLPAADGGRSKPAEAASDYALAFTNWTWRDVATKSSGVLARLAAGRLRESALANAAALRENTTLERDRVGNHGEQLALDVQLPNREGTPVWIVMRETASIDGRQALSDTRVRVYKVTVRQLEDRRWYVVGFEPQG